MAYNLRNRAQFNVKVPTIDIYDDPIAVPVQKMSFTVFQSKSNNETDGKWSSNVMHVAYLQNDELWDRRNQRSISIQFCFLFVGQ